MNKKIIRTYQLDIEKLKTIEDVKKILNVLQIRINTDNPLYEELEDYFTIEVIPPGYLKLYNFYEKEGKTDEIYKMTNEEIEQKIFKLGLLSNEETN